MPKIGAFWIPRTGNPDFLTGNLDADFATGLAQAERGAKGEYKVFLKRKVTDNPKAPAWELHVSTPREGGNAYQGKPSGPIATPRPAQAPTPAPVAASGEDELPF